MKIIIIEGIDGSGKSTIAMALYNMLNSMKYKTLLVREPGGTEVGEKIRNILLEKKNNISNKSQALLFFVAREELYKYLNENNVYDYVIFDRSHYSTLAYQVKVLKNIDYDIYKALVNKKYYELEDFIIFMNNSPTDVLRCTNKKLDKKDTYESKGIVFQHKLFKAYQEIFALKDNVLYLERFDTDTNLEKIKEYMKIGK